MLLAPGEKTGVCASCDVSDDGPDLMARRNSLARALARVPGLRRAFFKVLDVTVPKRRYETS